MSLTVNATPNNIDNSAIFNVTTSHSEDASHVNLRVRCDVTVSAVVIASIEKPKGLADFDLSEILKPSVPGISFARNSGALYAVTGGSPLVAYTVLFTEVFENSSGVTTTDDTDNASGVTFRYVPAKGNGTAFTEFVLHDDTCFFASETLRNNVAKFVSGFEYWLVFFTEVAHVELFYSKDGGTYDHATHFDPTDNWGVIILNVDEIFAGVTSNVRIQLGEVGGAKISEVITIYLETTCNTERVILEYDGLLGGKEYTVFEGLNDIDFTTGREYYKTSTKNRKALLYEGVNRQKLETVFKDYAKTAYLKSLLMSETVKRLESAYATATDVTVLSESATITKQDLFVNQIEVEYAY